MKKNKKLVILGTGFGAFSLIRKLKASAFDITVVSPRNYFLFTPLLPSATVGTLEPRSIVEPIRAYHQKVHFIEASAQDIQVKTKTIKLSVEGAPPLKISYDALVIAVGGVSQDFGIPGVNQHTSFLKEIEDARKIRSRIIECFELASLPDADQNTINQLLHFVIVGAGPTGVEFAGELSDFVREDLKCWYPQLVKNVKITILEATQEILTQFDLKFSEYALKQLHKMHIELRTCAKVHAVKKEEIILENGEALKFGLCVWSTGIGPTNFVKNISLPKNSRAQIKIGKKLEVLGSDCIYAIGDCASHEESALPQTAQVAGQQGTYLAKYLKQHLTGKSIPDFVFKPMGMLLSVGNNKAVAQIKSLNLTGFAAYFLWRSAYMTRLVGLRNKSAVAFDWIKSHVFGREISRF